MKARANNGNWSLKLKAKLTLPAFLIFLCFFFFLAGFFFSNLLSQDISHDQARSRSRSRLLQSVQDERGIEQQQEYLLPHGLTGDASITVIPFQVLSWKPRALYFPKFATAEQCQSIISMAKPSLTPSVLVFRDGENEQNTKGIRTSTGVFLRASEDQTGVLDDIEEKIARATMLPKSHGEAFNVLRYQIGQKYDSHYDAFNPAEYGPQKSQRVASFLLYLSDVEKGGETMFPIEDGREFQGYHPQKCIGLKVKPRRGDGLLFYSLFPNNTIDPTSIHGSCPVIKGEKWVITKWIRDHEY